MRYKESMFNAFTISGDKTLLYNSLEGMSSLAVIDFIKWESIIKNVRMFGKDDSQEFEKLLEKHYFCIEETDEHMLTEIRYMDVVEENVLRLIILPTEKCNFRCLYCYEEFKIGKMSMELQEDIIDYVRKNIMNFSGVDIRWFGGEPLMALDVIENISYKIIEICNRAKRRYTASIITNAYLLSRNTYERLIKCHVWLFQITVDGLKDSHDVYRPLYNGEGTFEKIMYNLKEIHDHDKFRYSRFTIRCNFTAKSAANVLHYIEYMKKIFGEDERFCFMLERASDWGGERVRQIEEQLLSNEEYGAMLQQISKYNIKINLLPHCALMDADSCVCYANKRHSYIVGANGKIYKCSGDFTFEENNIGYLTHGEMIIDRNKESLWLNRKARNLSKCQQCFFEGACLSACCPASFIKGTFGDANSLCLYEKEYISDFLKIIPDKFFTNI